MVGVLGKDRGSNAYILDRWHQTGLLEGLVGEFAMKVALSYEIATHFLLMEQKAEDICFKMTGEVISYSNGGIDTVIFPIIRRIVSRTPEASEFVPEIINMSKGYYNSNLWRMVSTGDERYIRYLYNNILPKWTKYHKERDYKDYDDLKERMYEKQKKRNNRWSVGSYEEFIPLDWEAEFCSAMAERIETDIKEHIKNREDGK